MKLALLLMAIGALLFVINLPGPETVHKVTWVVGIGELALVGYSLFFQSH